MNNYYTMNKVVKGDIMNFNKITIGFIADQVIKGSGFNIRNKYQQTHLLLLRKVYYKLARKYTLEPLERIGREVGKNHASVGAALSTVDKDLKDFPFFEDLYNKIEYKIIGKKQYKILQKPLGINIKTSVLRSLDVLNNKEMKDFEETRLKPYLSMLKSRRVHNIKTVVGAKLNNN